MFTKKQQPEPQPADQPEDQEPQPAPWQAYAIVPDPNNPDTWRLPHHTDKVKRAVAGKVGYEHTVDWQLVAVSVEMLSRLGHEGRRVDAEEGNIIKGARHLASHYFKAGKHLPDVLAALI